MQVRIGVFPIEGLKDHARWGNSFSAFNLYGLVEIEDNQGMALGKGLNAISNLTKNNFNKFIELEKLQTIAYDSFNTYTATIILCLIQNYHFHLVLFGKGAVYLVRNKTISCILNTHGSLSGSFKNGDEIWFFSGSLEKFMANTRLIEDLNKPNRSNIHQLISSQLFTRKIYGATGLMLKIGQLSDHFDNELKNLSTPPASHSYNKIDKKTFKDKIIKLLSNLQNIYLSFRSYFKSRNFRTLAVVIVSFAFIISVIIGIWKQASDKKLSEMRANIMQAQVLYDEGVALTDLNPKKGKEKLEEAKKILSMYLSSVSVRTKEGAEIQRISDSIDSYINIAKREYTFDAALFFDAGFVRSGLVIRSFVMVGNTVYFVLNDGSVAVLDIGTKKSTIIAGSKSLGNIQLIGASTEAVYLYTEKGIYKVTNTKTPVLVIPNDKEWGKIGSLVSFGGNIYLLDSQKSRIWKYQETETGFLPLAEYLNPDTLPDFTHAVQMVIDGSVFVNISGENILRFDRGKESSFSFRDVEPPVSANIMVYTSDESKYLYVLEKDTSRVIAVDKNGEYISQYHVKGINAEGIGVQEAQKIILLYAEGKLYSIPMK